MKNLRNLLTICLLITSYSFGQTTETFDIIAYQIPKGWQKEVNQNAVQLDMERIEIIKSGLFQQLLLSLIH